MTAWSNAWSNAGFAALTPRPRISVSEWADRHRVIPRGTSPEPGPWRTSRAPYLRAMMDSISDPAIERVIVQAGSQLGKTDGVVLNAIAYFASQDPSPILLVEPTEIAALSFSKERIDPTFRESPALCGLLSEQERDKSNTIFLRQFPGGYLALGWSTSAVSLASRPIRVLVLDEVDRFVVSTGRDGDPIAQAMQRTSNFPSRKIIAVSSPTVEDLSPIARLYEDTDRRLYHVPCPHCGVLQPLEWPRLIYKNAAGDIDLDQVHYRCEHCGERIEERHRPDMLADGEWVASNPGHRHAGFKISALYSPWTKWRELAAEWVRATADRDRHGQREFVNLRLGECWKEEAERITVEALEKNREDYDAEIPAGVALLTAGVDVQHNRLEAEIVGWGVGKESWGIEYRILPGDTLTPAPWAELDAHLARAWSRADGRPFYVQCACIDAGDGNRAREVYAWTRDRLARRIYAIKGRAGGTHPIVGKPTTSNQLGVTLYPVGADAGKEAVHARLAIATPGPGYCRFPIGRGYDAEYFKGLLAERRVMRMQGGRRVLEWRQTHARNEPLDIRVYSTAALEILNPNLEAFAAAAVGAPQPQAQPQRRRRVLHPGVTE